MIDGGARVSSRTILLVAAIVLVCAVPLGYRFFHPLVTVVDNNTASFIQPARNYVRHGLTATKLGLVVNAGEDGPFVYYAHHPPLSVLAAGAVFAVVGVEDWAARITPALFSIGSAVILFLLWRRVRGDLAGALAAMAMASLPGFGFMGKMLGEEAPTLMFGLLTILLYLRWRDALPGEAPRFLPASLASYALGCLSGWAAFHIGPILMIDAMLTLRSRRMEARRALLGIGLSGALCFALILGHFALLTGSLADIASAARGRLFSDTFQAGVVPGAFPWIAKMGEQFLRVFGLEAAIFALIGILSGAVALARRRVKVDVLETALLLAAFGAANPLVFRWQAYFHDWLQFHLLPIVAVAAAEGILFLATAGSAAFRALRAPRPVALAAAAAVLVGAAAERARVDARDLRALEADKPWYFGPLLGREVARGVPPESRFMANFPQTALPFRFYADRASRVVRGNDEFEALLREGKYALFFRDMNLDMDLDLALELERYPHKEIASFRLYDLQMQGRGEPDTASEPESASRWFEPLDADFDGVIRLIRCQAELPGGSLRPRSSWSSYLGFPGDGISPSRLVGVTSYWEKLKPETPDWTFLIVVTQRNRDGSWTTLPSVTPPDSTPRLSWWREAGRIEIRSGFLFTDDDPAGEYEVRLALYDGGSPVGPRFPGETSAGERKSVVAGRIDLFGDPGPASSP